MIPFSHSWDKQTPDLKVLNVPDEKDVCRQLLVFRAINRALVTLANEESEHENKLVITEEIYFFHKKKNFQKIRIITLNSFNSLRNEENAFDLFPSSIDNFN